MMVKEEEMDVPGCGADDALALVLLLDHVVLRVDELRDVPHEGQNLANTFVQHRQSGQDVDNGMRNRRHAL